MNEMGSVIPQRLGEVFAWLGAHGVAPAGPPFVRYYDVSDMSAPLHIAMGVPVASAVSGDERVSAGVLPAGRYAVLLHTGHPDGLFDATTALLAWAKKNGIAWQTTATEHGEVWHARLENYHTDPATEPDLYKWETELF